MKYSFSPFDFSSARRRPFSTTLPRALLIGLVLVATSLQGNPVRILPLGDSITHGRGGSGETAAKLTYSYRYELWKMLIDAGVDFDFVGEMVNGFDSHILGDPDYPDYKGRAFDKDHEGHWGWTTDTILKGTSSWRKTEGKLPLWLDAYTPDISLIILGTNDGRSSSFNLDKTVANMTEIIGQLREANPQIIILLGLLYQGYDPLPDINVAYRELAENLSTENSPIVIVDHTVGWDNDADTIDGDHTSPSGDLKVAQNWFKALTPFVLKNYDNWRDTQFDDSAPNDESAREDDPDRDGFSNWIEYAMGTPPLIATPRDHVLQVSASYDQFLCTFAPVSGLNDVRYILEGSTDPVNWNDSIALFDSQIDSRPESGPPIEMPLEALPSTYLRIRLVDRVQN